MDRRKGGCERARDLRGKEASRQALKRPRAAARAQRFAETARRDGKKGRTLAEPVKDRLEEKNPGKVKHTHKKTNPKQY